MATITTAGGPKTISNSELRKTAKNYFLQLPVIAVGLGLTFLFTEAFGAHAWSLMFSVSLLLMTTGFAIYLYAWALIKTFKISRKISDGKTFLVLGVLASLIGPLVPITMVAQALISSAGGPGDPLNGEVFIPWFLYLGLSLVPIQVVTFALIAKRGKAQ
ncbi:unannotated protein [freshwater metagenome]|uniref:Unannotated protein n=1 Tax=freshwater metagenome TaxID=449393 RepID=A0A6J7JTL1_9ZZZZ|nr:hypothetical protein [Actinomycetota bacterium]